MKTTKYKKIEELLSKYPDLDDIIADRREELMTPWRPTDENIGGGKPSATSVSTTERTVVRIVDDPTLMHLAHLKHAVDHCLAHSDDDTVAIIKGYYMAGHNGMPITALADRLCVSDRTARRKKQSFLEALSDYLSSL